uniref:hypothetical protein n=1 Tax=Bacillaceae bacterium JMAK1 TaxID=1028381 RepID=UPI0003AC56EB|nr:hypothetical protein [Bacillaceae bacterium JMAK1]AGQ45443.1 hypothetical protein [Bacillaceae bacterium JMAK1]
MNRVLSAILSPLVLAILIGIINTPRHIYYNTDTSFNLDGMFLAFYLIALLIYSIVGIPLSIVIDKVIKPKRIKWLYYMLGGIVGTLIIFLANYSLQPNSYLELSISNLLVSMSAGLAYYLSQISVNFIRNKLR